MKNEEWTVKCELWKCKILNILKLKCKVKVWMMNYSENHELWNLKCVVWTVKYEVWHLEFEAWIMSFKVWTTNFEAARREVLDGHAGREDEFVIIYNAIDN